MKIVICCLAACFSSTAALMRMLKPLAIVLGSMVLGLQAYAAEDLTSLPRNQTLIVENPEGTIRNAGWFNIWAANGGGLSTGLQQLGMDTFWYIDPDYGINNQVWDNSLASDPPIYNQDFTEMTVKLRQGLTWSDGVEFTADDVVYTIQEHQKNEGLVNWHPAVSINVDSISAPDKYTVVFKLKKPNSRFHALFTVRWNAMWMMPKHIFEKQPDAAKYAFNPPVTIGSYKLHSFDPNGGWFIWEKRDDWNNTSLGRFGEPSPKYVAYIDPGPPEKRVIAQLNHQLDIIHDLSSEAMLTLAKQSKTLVTWFKGFPYAHPDPTLPMVIFNDQLDKFKNPDLRWALTLLIDIKAVDMAAYRGAATISALAVPPTGTYPKFYFDPLQQWLKDFTIDTGKQTIHPYDPTAGQQIADLLRPTYGAAIPSDPAAIARSIGMGWWKPNPQAATELLEKAGFKHEGGKWLMPDGKPFTIKILVEGNARSIMTNAGTLIAQEWKDFGLDASTEVSTDTVIATRRPLGDFEVLLGWSVETWGGHPDLSFFLDSWHSEFVAKPGERQAPRNWQRWSSPELDKIIEQIRTVGFDDPKGLELGQEYAKLMVKEMPVIPLMSYNVFTAMDTKYWTGYPNAETDPYTDPVPNWANSRVMMVKLKPTGAN
jgi:peptide/nickel transport system substrate-binding protein